MSGYIGPAPVPQATQTRQTFTATSGQTSFATIGYVAGGQFIQVYLNGVLLKLTDDYTAANGSDIVLTSGAATGDILEFITFADFTVNNQNFTGGLTVDNDGSTVLTVDRATSDGTIIDLQKSGSSVASIGVVANDRLYIATDDSANAGLAFDGDNSRIYACTSVGDTSDNTTDLGSETQRFKDLYLSGGVVFGDAGGSGTSTSNTLDSYEEGTWTPIFKGTTTNPTVSYNSQTQGHYTKIGQVVIARGTCYAASASGGSGSLAVGGLPFNIEVGTYSGRSGGVTISQADNFDTNDHPTAGAGTINTAYFLLRQILTSSGTNTLTTSALQNTSLVRFQFVYTTTA